MTDPSRVRFVVEHYSQLQGLRLVPLGLVFIGVAAWQAGQLRWLPGSEDGGAAGWFLGAFSLAIAVSFVIRRYYERMLRGIQFRPFRTGGPRMLAIGSVVIVSVMLQDQFRWPVSVPMILGYVGIIERRVRQHYLSISAACLLLANTGAFDVTARTQQVLFDLLIAGGLLVAGIGDHLVFTHRTPGCRIRRRPMAQRQPGGSQRDAAEGRPGTMGQAPAGWIATSRLSAKSRYADDAAYCRTATVQ